MRIFAIILLCIGFACLIPANVIILSDSPAQHHARAALLNVCGAAVSAIALILFRRSKRGPDA
jgi:hypothetical protein